jgi:hypothetical protein
MTKKTENPQSIETMMCEALLRSGYVMESRIVHSLVDQGFFVEPNQRVIDPATGKSREIDLVAELWNSAHAGSRLSTRVSVNVRFVCEAKNNRYPIVLLTELPFSPNLEIWESLHEGRTGFFKTELLDPSFFDFLTDGQKLYTQYCSFKPKRNEKDSEWLAWHPDDFHDDLEKIVTYCRSEAEQMGELKDDFHRLFLYMPVVILSGDLYLAKPENAKVALSKVAAGLHMHFGMHEEMQCLSLVLFVTEGNSLPLFDEIIRFGQSIESTVVQKLSSEERKS